MKTKLFYFLLMFVTLFGWQNELKAQFPIQGGDSLPSVANFITYKSSQFKLVPNVKTELGKTVISETYRKDYFIYEVAPWEAKEYAVYLQLTKGASAAVMNVDFFDTLDSAKLAVSALDSMTLANINLTRNQSVFPGSALKEYFWIKSFPNARQTKYMRIHLFEGNLQKYGPGIFRIRFEQYDPKIMLNTTIAEANEAKNLLSAFVAPQYALPLDTALTIANQMFADPAYDNIMFMADKQNVVTTVRDSLVKKLDRYRLNVKFIIDPNKDYLLERVDSSIIYADPASTAYYVQKPSKLMVNIPDFYQSHFSIKEGTVVGKYTAQNRYNSKFLGGDGAQSTSAYQFSMAYVGLQKNTLGENEVYFGIYAMTGGKFLDQGGAPFAYTNALGTKLGTYSSGIPKETKCWYKLIPVDKPTMVLKQGLKDAIDAVYVYQIEAEQLFNSGLVTEAQFTALLAAEAAANIVFNGDETTQTQIDIDAAILSLNSAVDIFKLNILFTPKIGVPYKITSPNEISLVPSNYYSQTTGLVTTYGNRYYKLVTNVATGLKDTVKYLGVAARKTRGATSTAEHWILQPNATALKYSFKNDSTGNYLSATGVMDTLYYAQITYARMGSVKTYTYSGETKIDSVSVATPYFTLQGFTGGNLDVGGTLGNLDYNKVSPWGTGISAAKSTFRFELVNLTASTKITGFNFNAYGLPGKVLIKGAEGKMVSIYSFDGKMVSVLKRAESISIIPLSAGFYIVKVGNQAVKVSVR